MFVTHGASYYYAVQFAQFSIGHLRSGEALRPPSRLIWLAIGCRSPSRQTPTGSSHCQAALRHISAHHNAMPSSLARPVACFLPSPATTAACFRFVRRHRPVIAFHRHYQYHTSLPALRVTAFANNWPVRRGLTRSLTIYDHYYSDATA